MPRMLMGQKPRGQREKVRFQEAASVDSQVGLRSQLVHTSELIHKERGRSGRGNPEEVHVTSRSSH